MKHLISIAFIFLLPFIANAQFAYIKKSNVNLRTGPSTSSSITGKANVGEVYHVIGQQGEWTQIEQGYEEDYVWISSQFVKILNNDIFPEEKINAQFSIKDGSAYGFLTFEKAGKNEYGVPLVRYSILVKDTSLYESGGNGVIINETNTVIYYDASLSQPEGCSTYASSSAIYDSKKKLLYFADILWNED